MNEQNAQVKTPEKKNKKKRHGGGIGLLVLLIIVILMFLLTTIILGTRLYELSTQDEYGVDVGVGEVNGEIELFHVTYENATGEITVEGTNGQEVVAPGTSVDYDVHLRNQDDVIVDFVMSPAVEYYTAEVVPVNFKIMDNYGNYIMGDENTWVAANSMNDIAHKGSIHPGEVYTYHVSWQWAFESGNDEYDTLLGNSDGAGLRVSMNVQSSASAVETKTVSHLMHLLGEGFGCCWCCWLVWILLLVIALLLIWVFRLKRVVKKQDEELDEYEEFLEQNNLHLTK